MIQTVMSWVSGTLDGETGPAFVQPARRAATSPATARTLTLARPLVLFTSVILPRMYPLGAETAGCDLNRQPGFTFKIISAQSGCQQHFPCNSRGPLGQKRKTPSDRCFHWSDGVSRGWQMRDSNPRRRCQLIYSQPPLAARVICRTSKEDHSRLPCSERCFQSVPLPATAGKTTLQNFCRRIESSPAKPLKKPRKIRLLRGCGPASFASNWSACSSVIWFSCTARCRSAWTPSSRDEASGAGLRMIEAATAAAATDGGGGGDRSGGGGSGAGDVADGLVVHVRSFRALFQLLQLCRRQASFPPCVRYE